MTETATAHLWEVDHPYYCSESNYYVGGIPRPYPNGQPRPVDDSFVPFDHVEVESWDAFGWKDSDPDMNLLFRWDWQVPDPDDLEDGEEPVEKLLLFWMLQRKGRFMAMSMPVQREEEPAIREWLQGRFAHLLKLWEPFSCSPTEGGRSDD